VASISPALFFEIKWPGHKPFDALKRPTAIYPERPESNSFIGLHIIVVDQIRTSPPKIRGRPLSTDKGDITKISLKEPEQLVGGTGPFFE